MGGTNDVLHSSAKKIKKKKLCTLWSLALAKKSCNNISKSKIKPRCATVLFGRKKTKNNHKNVRKTCYWKLIFVICSYSTWTRRHAKHTRHVATWARTQDTLTREYVSTKDTLAREHVSTQGTLGREHIRHAIKQTQGKVSL